MTAKKPQNTFLVCVNESEHSKTALHYAMTKARVTGAEVLILYVIDPVDYSSPFAVGNVMKESRMQEAEGLVGSFIEKAQSWGGSLPRTSIREGSIREGILTTLQEEGSVSLLIIGVSSDGSTHKSKLFSQITAEIGAAFSDSAHDYSR